MAGKCRATIDQIRNTCAANPVPETDGVLEYLYNLLCWNIAYFDTSEFGEDQDGQSCMLDSAVTTFGALQSHISTMDDPSLIFSERQPILSQQAGEPSEWQPARGRGLQSNPKAFYSGNAATDEDVEAGLDFMRSQYARPWKDDEGKPQRPWKDLLVPQAEKILQKRVLRLVVLFGPKGAGKSTLLKRMAHDLRALSFPVEEYLTGSIDVAVVMSPLNRNSGKCIHVFARVSSAESSETMELLQSIARLNASQVGVIVYLAVDTNVWKRIEGRVKDAKQHGGWLLEERHLRGQLDVQEVNDLILLLRKHNCLFRLEHKSEAAIQFLFRKKARRGLLTCLIECTRGTDKVNDLSDILWLEYQSLPKEAQDAYALTMLFSSVGIGVPAQVMRTTLSELTGSPGYFASQSFMSETSEVIWLAHSGCYGLRHPLIAQTMLDRIKTPSWDNFKYRLFRVWLASTSLADSVDDGFFRVAMDRKVFKCLSNLEPIVEELNKGAIATFDAKAHSRILNSVIRILQGRRSYGWALELCERSLELWPHRSNQAVYLRGFCAYHLGNRKMARETASDLLLADDPYFMLHGISLLVALREWRLADGGIKGFTKSYGSDGLMYPEIPDLLREVNYGLSLSAKSLSDAIVGNLRPTALLARLQLAIAQAQSDLDEEEVITEFKNLLRRQHNLKPIYHAFFSYLLRWREGEDGEDNAIQRLTIVREECEYHLNQHEGHFRHYPKEILSVLHGSLGRAFFRIDHLSSDNYPSRENAEIHLLEALRLDKQNWYADDWYGTFAKEVKQDSSLAQMHYQRAIRGDRDNPIFKHNLALLYYEWPKFSRHLLEIALKEEKEALHICETDSQWSYFGDFPRELLSRIATLMSRSDISNGEQLDRGESSFLEAD